MSQSTERPPLTSAERQIILEEYESYPRGDPRRGALLRRHGIYTSQIAKWRQRLKQGAISLDRLPPGPKPEPPNPLADELARLRRENARLQAQLLKAETIIDVQKKVATLLNLTQTLPPDEPS
jgi:transposase